MKSKILAGAILALSTSSVMAASIGVQSSCKEGVLSAGIIPPVAGTCDITQTNTVNGAVVIDTYTITQESLTTLTLAPGDVASIELQAQCSAPGFSGSTQGSSRTLDGCQVDPEAVETEEAPVTETPVVEAPVVSDPVVTEPEVTEPEIVVPEVVVPEVQPVSAFEFAQADLEVLLADVAADVTRRSQNVSSPRFLAFRLGFVERSAKRDFGRLLQNTDNLSADEIALLELQFNDSLAALIADASVSAPQESSTIRNTNSNSVNINAVSRGGVVTTTENRNGVITVTETRNGVVTVISQ